MENKSVDKWYKKSEQSNYRQANVILNYEYMGPSIPNKIIGPFNIKNSNNIYIKILNSNKGMKFSLDLNDKDLCEFFINEAKNEGIINYLEKDFDKFICWYKIDINLTNKEAVKTFINIINKKFPINEDFKKELIEKTKIKFSLVEKSKFIKEQLKLIENNELEKVLKNILEIDEDEILWEISEYYEKRKINSEELNKEIFQNCIDCYQSFKSNSIFYSKANIKIHEIIMEILNAADNHLIHLDKGEIKEYKEEIFRCLNNLQGIERENYQNVKNRIYDELCGNDLGRDVEEIENDTETLIRLARKIEKLQEENKKIKIKYIYINKNKFFDCKEVNKDNTKEIPKNHTRTKSF